MSEGVVGDNILVWTNIDGENRWRIEMRIPFFDLSFEPKLWYKPDEIDDLLGTGALREYGVAIISRLGSLPYTTTYLDKRHPWRLEFTVEGIEPAVIEDDFKALIEEAAAVILFLHWDLAKVCYMD